MRRRLSKLYTATAAVLIALPALGGCEAKVYGTTPHPPTGPPPTATGPEGNLAPLSQGPPATFERLADRVQQATVEAAQAGAEITVVVLDRNTGQIVDNGNGTTLAIASVAKLFIADDLLIRAAQGDTELSPEDRQGVEVMLRSSDDNSAETFWNEAGGSDIINRVAGRYGLGSTAPPSNGRWWNTVSTAADLVRYYDMLLDGTGGLPSEQTEVILSSLAQSTPVGVDGYPQRFGIPDGLFAEPVAVKQGWMCCIGANWMHLSTGVIGPERRYVMAIGSMQASDEQTARNTITQAVKTMFPDGRI